MGYEINRFTKNSVSEDFCCPVCQNVLQDPLIIESCEHIFCKSCINHSLEQEEKCPIDGKNVTLKQVREPIRSFKNLLGQLEISCEFTSFGCKKYIKLDQLETHLKTCSYGPKDLNIIECICGLKMNKSELEEHQSNCICYLQIQLKQLKSSLELLEQKGKQRINENNSGVKTFFDEWNSSGREVKVINSDMSAEKKMDAISIIKDGLNQNDTNFLKKLTMFFSEKYGDIWYALVVEVINSFKYAKDNYLLVSIGRKKLRLFKTLKFSVVDTIKEARTVAKPEIVKNTMKILMTDDAMTFAARAAYVGENFLQMASLIRDRFAEKYGINWNCLISADNFGLSYTPKQQTLINMKFGDMFVVIWQCP